jgi:hypothetical protein
MITSQVNREKIEFLDFFRLRLRLGIPNFFK